jgi:hypothetical protein
MVGQQILIPRGYRTYPKKIKTFVKAKGALKIIRKYGLFPIFCFDLFE